MLRCSILLLVGCTPRMGRLDLESPAVVSELGLPASVADTTRFAVLGDFGHQDDGALPASSRTLLDRVLEGCPDCDFVVLAGDNVYPNGVPRSGDTRVLDAIADAVPIPVVVVLGNHDWGAYWWPFGGASRQRATRELEWIARRDDVVGGHFWSLDTPAARLVGLDSTYLVRRCSKTGTCRGQDAIAILRPTFDTDRWTVAVGHHPLASDGWHGDAGHYADPVVSLGRGRGYRTLLEAVSPDLVVSGHDHHLQVVPDGSILQVVSGSGSEQRPVRARASSLFASDQAGFALVTLTSDELRIEIHTEGACTAFTRDRTSAPRPAPCGGI
ncbi:MAG: metallophosphoesterase [Myxococcota bacterium]